MKHTDTLVHKKLKPILDTLDAYPEVLKEELDLFRKEENGNKEQDLQFCKWAKAILETREQVIYSCWW